jgi:hypothetical protein
MLPASSLMMLSIGNCSDRGPETETNEEARCSPLCSSQATWRGPANLFRVNPHRSAELLADRHAEVLRQPGNAPTVVKARVQAAPRVFQNR